MSPDTPERVVDNDHPWLGLTPFTEATKSLFFGRDHEIRNLFLRVREHPLTVLFGQSGLGKTSLLGAGLIPKLRVEGYRPCLLRLGFEAGFPPLIEQLFGALNTLLPQSADGRQRDRPQTLWEIFHHLPSRVPDLTGAPPVVLLDQFEEIFSLTTSAERQNEAEEFFEQVADLIENRPPERVHKRLLSDRPVAREYDLRRSSVRIVIVVREDYLSHLEAWNKVMPSLMRNRVGLDMLDGLQARDAVMLPGKREGRELISEPVAAHIVRFVAERPPDTPLAEIRAVPPLLSLLCDELNEARLQAGASTITHEQVDQQSADILRNFYTRAFENLHPAVRHFVEDCMITVGGHRIPVARENAVANLVAAGVPTPEIALDGLIKGRLLSAESRGGVPRLEIGHDVLVPMMVRSRHERQERERTEQAQRETDRQRRRVVRWTVMAAVFVALVMIALTQVILARQGRAFARAKHLIKQATTDLNAGYDRFSQAQADVRSATELLSGLTARLAETTNRLRVLDSGANNLVDRLESNSVEVKSLDDKLRAMQKQAADLQFGYTGLNRRQPEVKLKLQDAEVTLRTLDPTLRSNYSIIISGLATDLDQAHQALERSTPDLVQLGHKVSVLVEQQRIQNRRLASTQALLTNTQKAVQGITNQLTKLSNALAGVGDGLDQAERELKSGRETLQIAQTSLEMAENALNEATAKLLGSVRLRHPKEVIGSERVGIFRVSGMAPYAGATSTEARNSRQVLANLSRELELLPEPIAKIESALAASDRFQTDLEDLRSKVQTFERELEEAAFRIAGVHEATRIIDGEASDLRIQSTTLADDTNALIKSADKDLEAAKRLLRAAGSLCAEIAGDVLRINQADSDLRRLVK